LKGKGGMSWLISKAHPDPDSKHLERLRPGTGKASEGWSKTVKHPTRTLNRAQAVLPVTNGVEMGMEPKVGRRRGRWTRNLGNRKW
jgi:hypothetical protein